jgi:hypothetical protein
MLAVQLCDTQIARLCAFMRFVGLLVLVSASVASIILAASSPCNYRQRIWIGGFSLGDQCIATAWQ